MEAFKFDSSEMKIGVLVRSTLKRLLETDAISHEMVRFLMDAKYCKNTFDLNYTFLKKVDSTSPVFEQRKINGYDRFWAEVIIIYGEKYIVCNDWYEKNRSKLIRWVRNIT